MLNIANVSKKLGGKQVLNNINLNIERGSIFGLIGPNGAGKTTLIKCITGIYDVDEGGIKVNGEKTFDNSGIKNIMGYVPDENSQFSTFKVKDMIKFYSLSYKNFDTELFNKFNLYFKIPKDRFIGKLSKGMKTRLSIMLNLSINPEILIMDEPTSGLDPMAKKAILNLIVDKVADKGITVVISSHNLSDLERICDSVAIINDNEIKYTNSIENMKKNIRKFQMVFKDKVPTDIEKLDNVINVSNVGRVYNVVIGKGVDDFLEKLKEKDLVFYEEIDLSLEDMFIYSVGGDALYEGLFK